MALELTHEQFQNEIGDIVAAALEKRDKAQAAEAERKAAADAAKPKIVEPVAGDFKPTKGTAGAIIRSLAATRCNINAAAAFAHDVLKHADAQKALELGDMGAGGAMVPPAFIAEIIELLAAKAVVRSLNPTIIPMPNGATSQPKLTGGATAYYIGEAQAIPASQQTLGMVSFRERKLATLVPLSNDLLRVPSVSADQMAQNDMVGAMARREDLAFIRGTGTEFVPKGLDVLCPTDAAHTIVSNGTVNVANVTIDLGKCLLALEESNCNMLRPGWLMAPRSKQYLRTARDGNGNYVWRDEMNQGRLEGFPFAVTTQIPRNLGSGDESTVYFCDWADIVIAESLALEMAMSNETAYDPGTGTLISAFQNDLTVIRALAKHDLGCRHDESIVRLTAVHWGV